MKRKLIILLFLLLGVAAYAQYQRRAVQHFITVNSSTAVPVSITTNVAYWANVITFKGLKASQTDNTGDVYIGVETGNGTQHVKVTAGGEVVYRCPPNEQINLANFYLDVTTANDGI